MNRPSFPLYASVNITTSCNLDCIYCYMKPHKNENMKLNDFKRIIDELAEESIFYILLSGGEPFLHPNIQEIIEYSCRKINEVSLVTNGTLISDDHIDFLKEIDTSNLSLQVSLDSIVEKENYLLRSVNSSVVTEKIKALSNVGVSLSIGLVMSKYNYHSICETVLCLYEHVKHFNIMVLQNTVKDNKLVSSIGVNEEDVNKIYQWMANFSKGKNFSVTLPKDIAGTDECTANGAPCSAAFTYLAIDPDLNVRPCDRVTDVYIGNLRENSIREIWDSANSARINNRMELLCINYR